MFNMRVNNLLIIELRVDERRLLFYFHSSLFIFFFSSEATAITSNLRNDKNNDTLDAVLLRISVFDNKKKANGKRGREKRLKNNIRIAFSPRQRDTSENFLEFYSKATRLREKFLGMRDKFNLAVNRKDQEA